MLESGRLKILETGISSLRIKTPSNKEKYSPVEDLSPGTEVDFSAAQLSTKEGVILSVTGMSHGNGLRTIVKFNASVVAPPSALSIPPFTEKREIGQGIGSEPGGANSILYGVPQPGVEITFLGHPHRDDVEALMRGDLPGHDDRIFGDKRLLFVGKTVPVTINDWRGETGVSLRQPRSGEFIIGGYESFDRRRPYVDIFTAMRSSDDGLVRVVEKLDIAPTIVPSENPEASQFVSELAALSVFTSTLNEPRYEALREDVSINSWSHLATNLRLPTRHPLELRHRLPDTDWQVIKKGLPEDELAYETDRLADALGIQYEK